ncbi:MAG: hypothetical protein IPL65_18475 [Lewinellaceae bacterium]|nr:hypothetical protein [Lewinellaceae bacterium]
MSKSTPVAAMRWSATVGQRRAPGRFFLSGGIDSSAIVALMVEVSSSRPLSVHHRISGAAFRRNRIR